VAHSVLTTGRSRSRDGPEVALGDREPVAGVLGTCALGRS